MPVHTEKSVKSCKMEPLGLASILVLIVLRSQDFLSNTRACCPVTRTDFFLAAASVGCTRVLIGNQAALRRNLRASFHEAKVFRKPFSARLH